MRRVSKGGGGLARVRRVSEGEGGLARGRRVRVWKGVKGLRVLNGLLGQFRESY